MLLVIACMVGVAGAASAGDSGRFMTLNRSSASTLNFQPSTSTNRQFMPLGKNIPRVQAIRPIRTAKKIEHKTERQFAFLPRLFNRRHYDKKVLDWPLNDGFAEVSSGFGKRIHPVTGESSFHSGIDIRAPMGTKVLAAADGMVIKVGFERNLGKFVTIQHHCGEESLYGHLSSVDVREGEMVSAGDDIARVGNTGRTTGTHLHFTYVKDGKRVDPARYLTMPKPSERQEKVVAWNR